MNPLNNTTLRLCFSNLTVLEYKELSTAVARLPDPYDIKSSVLDRPQYTADAAYTAEVDYLREMHGYGDSDTSDTGLDDSNLF